MDEERREQMAPTNDEQSTSRGIELVNNPEGLVAALQALRGKSSYSFKALAQAIDRPTTTVHGWFSGRHLPYQRDNDDFSSALTVLGVADTEPWMKALARCRTTPEFSETKNPYRGLASFTEEDAKFFFGRDDVCARLLSRVGGLDRHLPLVVLGASGSGKTSLLRAGFLPAVRARLERPARYVTLGEQPLVTLNEVLAESDGPGQIIVVDQFEEVFSYEKATAVEVLALLEAFVGSADREVVIGLRSDFFREAEAHEWLVQGLSERQVVVTAPGIESLSEMITRPAETCGLSVEPALTVKLVDSLRQFGEDSTATSALPLLSHVLFQVAERQSGDRLTVDDYEAAGGIRVAVERSAEDAFGKLGVDDQRHCEALFKRLVQMRPDSVLTRRSVNLVDLENQYDDGLDLDNVLAGFTSARILEVDADWVQLSHEALLTAWPRLVSWIEDERAVLDVARRLEAAVDVWVDSDEDEHALLGGRLLAEVSDSAESLAMSKRMSETSERFIVVSFEADQQRQRSRRRSIRLLVGLAVVTTMAAGLATVFAVRSQRDSDSAEQASRVALSRQLALQSAVLRPTDASLSAQLALVAFDVSPSVDARSAVLDATADMPSTRYLGDPGATALAVSADGSRVAYSNSVTGDIKVLTPDGTGQYMPEFDLQIADPEVDIFALALSPDGSHLASGGTDMYVSLWDLDGDRVERSLDDSRTAFSLPIQSIDFDASGRFVYGSGTSEVGIGVWDIERDPLNESGIIAATGSTMGIDVNDARRLLATANLDGSASLWSLDNQREPLWLDSAEGQLAVTATLSPDGNFLAVGYRTGVFRVWDVADTSSIAEVTPEYPSFVSWVNSVRFSPDGGLLAAGGEGGIRFWNTTNWQEVGNVTTPVLVTNIRFVSDDLALFTAADGSMRSVSLDDPRFRPLGGTVWSVSYVGGTNEVAASSRATTEITPVIDSLIGRPTLSVPVPEQLDRFTGTNAVSPDGRFMALGSSTGHVVLVDLETGDETIIDGLTELAREMSGDPEATLNVENVAFSHDSSVLGAVGGEGFTQFWIVSEAGEATPAGGLQVPGLGLNIAFDADRPIVAIASDTGSVFLYDLEDPSEPTLLSEATTGEDFSYGLSFHPDKPVLATGNADKTIVIWDMVEPSAPRMITRITGPNGRVSGIAFASDGEQLAASVGDGTAWVWDTSTLDAPELAASLSIADQNLVAIAFSSDGQSLAAGGGDQRVYLWSLDVNEARRKLCADVGDQITPDEWTDFVPDIEYSPPCG
jgi:WD40 repeat protein